MLLLIPGLVSLYRVKKTCISLQEFLQDSERSKRKKNYSLIMMMMPTGFRFNPTDEELIEFLFRKLSGQEMQLYGDFIVERGVYELDPQHLQCLLRSLLSSLSSPYYKVLVCLIYF